MSYSVWAFDANPAIDPRLGKTSNSDAIGKLELGLAVRIGAKAIQLLPTAEQKAEHSLKQARPLPIRSGPHVPNYPIPAWGDHRLRWMYRFMHAAEAQ